MKKKISWLTSSTSWRHTVVKSIEAAACEKRHGGGGGGWRRRGGGGSAKAAGVKAAKLGFRRNSAARPRKRRRQKAVTHVCSRERYEGESSERGGKQISAERKEMKRRRERTGSDGGEGVASSEKTCPQPSTCYTPMPYSLLYTATTPAEEGK